MKTQTSCRHDADVDADAATDTDVGVVNHADGNVGTHTPLHWRRSFLFPALGGLLFGYDIGATSGAVVSIKDAAHSGVDWWNLSPLATGFVSGSLGGAVAGSALAFIVADRLGRRRELMVAAGLYLLGAAVMAGAPTLEALVAGRFIYGFGIGLAMHAAPMYIAETAPASLRGSLISLKEVLIVVGILMGYLIGDAQIEAVSGWRVMYGASAPVALLMAAGMLWLPPSPRWLCLCASQAADAKIVLELKSRAEGSLRRLRGQKVEDSEVAREMDEIVMACQDVVSGAGPDQGGFRDLLRGASLQALIIGGGLVFFQQVTGQPSVLYYATSILKDAGFAAATDATRVAVYLGTFKLAMTAVAVLTVDKWGRRPLLLVGISGIVVSLGLLTAYYYFGGGVPAASVIALLLYVGSYQISFGPVSWLMVSEVFPLRVRGRAQSLATLINFASNGLVVFAIPPVEENVGQSGTFFLFGLIAIASLAFVYLKVPETKGLSLEEIEAKLVE
eukprot:SM000072S21164  [mRNA]  locus=s72:21950:26506:- [translate_table: standard]